MKVKTSELTGAALDWAVARCLGTEHLFAGHEVGRLHYSTDWAQGGPIIEREGICLYFNQEDADWEAYIVCEDKKFGGVERFECTGSTPLIAAMRCYVASKLGEECDIPDELITGE